jgi:hypothetical protein
MSWDLYHNYLLPMVVEANIFPVRQENKVRIPLEIKILICLRRLGRGLVADDVSELANVAASTVEVLFHQFVEGLVDHFFDSWVKMHTGERLTRSMQVYQMLGFPGCRGSGDATHILWDRCPASLYNQMKGKEGVPSLGFFVFVDHHKYIQYCSNGFDGATNDKTMANVDDLCLKFRRGEMHDVEYYLMDKDGHLVLCRGLTCWQTTGSIKSIVL